MNPFKCPENPVWADIAPAFSAHDVTCMKQNSTDWPVPLDLRDYTSVYANKDGINAAVNSKQMPMDDSEQPWAPLPCWNAWYAAGCPEK